MDIITATRTGDTITLTLDLASASSLLEIVTDFDPYDYHSGDPAYDEEIRTVRSTVLAQLSAATPF